MRILVPSDGPGVRDAVAEHFGRAAYLILVDTKLEEPTVFSNQAAAQAEHCAGTQAVGTALEMRADVVVCQSIGPEAFGELSAARVPVFVEAVGTVQQAVDDFERQQLSQAAKPNRQSHQGRLKEH